MWRFFIGCGFLAFSFSALASLTLIVMCGLDGEYKDMSRAAMGAAVFIGLAFAFRRDWQRLEQRREFERENAAAREVAAGRE